MNAHRTTRAPLLALGVTSFLIAVGVAPGIAAAADLIVDGSTMPPQHMSGVHYYDNIQVINGGVILVDPYDNGPDKVNHGNLQLVASTIFIDATSSIRADGAGYQPILCDNGAGPNATAGGRGGCAVNDSGGGGAHFGKGGRGTKDCFIVAPAGSCQFPQEWEEDCGYRNGGACVATGGTCYNYDALPTVAGGAYSHSIWEVEFGAAGGDKGCRDGDGWSGACGSAGIPLGGAGGGRIVLAAVNALGTGQLTIVGTVNANGHRGCGEGNDSAGGGAGGSVLLVGDRVSIAATARVSAAGGLGGDTQADTTGECPPCSQKTGTCDDCGGGGGGGIISVLSGQPAVLQDLAVFNVAGSVGGVCPICSGEAGGGAGELQLAGVYTGETCDGLDNDFDGSADNALADVVCGTGVCEQTVQACTAGTPNDCVPLAGCTDPIDDTRSRFMVIVDTSGSMLLDLDGNFTFGDGSFGHVGLDTNNDGTAGNDSRLYQAKNALGDVISAYIADIDFGLSRFAQGTGTNVNCQLAHWFECSGICCTYDNPQNNSGTQACTVTAGLAGPQAVRRESPTLDQCVNYAGSCGSPHRGADVLVGFDRPVGQHLMWLDHHEDNFLNVRTEGDHCNFAGGGDCELRGTGPTPLADSLYAAKAYLARTRAVDGIGTCRKYGLILLTDGAETCRGNPVAAAADLLSTLGIETFVIGFSVLPEEQASLNLIAHAGSTSGTRNAILASNEDELFAALASIVADSVVFELCNELDDDCDGQVDEDFPAKGQECDDGLLGVCRGTGHYVCSADELGVECDVEVPGLAPGPEVCNGLDDDCDGEIDEDDVCCNGPEICNGVDDYCDTWTSHAEGSEDPRIVDGLGQPLPCGTAVGICELGTMACGVSGAPECVGGTGPEPQEQCDTLDRNCNGLINDVPPQECDITVGPDTCKGVQICDATGSWSACMGRAPTPEVCNNQDDNCNTQIDEGLAVPISCGVGACAHTVTFCVNGVEQVCDPLEGASPEAWADPNVNPAVCDLVDQDCNGIVNDGVPPRTCQNGNSFGICTGQETCNALGHWVGCTAREPQAEVCNGLDDNCDGQTDEGLPPQPCYPPGYGPTTGCSAPGACTLECHEGQRTCQGGHYGACVGAVTPVAEVCDGKDNNCNGFVDDGLGSTWCGLGVCLHEQANCVLGNLVVCNPLQGAGVETCNGLDDDCDGLVDDGVTRTCYPQATLGCVETPPGSGTFVCQGECATGAENCTTDGSGDWSGDCQGATIPVGELCDGLDNDCDGTVDDGITRSCYPFGSGCVARADGTGYDCFGVCVAGGQTCVVGGGGTWGGCAGAVGPSTETCNGLDDDCDNQTDEDAAGQPLSQPCSRTNASGTCTGVQICAGAVYGACSAPEPGPEAWADPNVNPAVCDTVDQNCNGVVNDGVPPRTCAVTNTHGTCTGTETCTAQGTWVGCTARTPQAEVCNGVDDDCDGFVDEDGAGNPLTQSCYSGPGGTAGVGVCAAGLRTCTSGGWGPCVGQVLPTPEVCDGLDNDCDHSVDEDSSGQPLARVCQNTNTWGTCLGNQTCTGAPGGSWTACTAQTPLEEVCDGVDNNCDGVIDGISRTCYPYSDGCTPDGLGGFQCEGLCWPGIELCPALGAPAPGNSFGSCQHAVGPSPEVCDGLDNDCDTFVDEDAQGSPLAQTCYWPGYGPTTGCTAPGTCEGLCQEGTRVCGVPSPGEWGACLGEVTPAQEVCDATDNDCDGEMDEPEDMPWIGQPCPASAGVCNGVWECTNGQQVCVGGATQPGRCNSVDDDCDGVTDELDELQQDPEFEQACGIDVGTCREGVKECIGGAWVCIGSVGPSQEVCDGTDNDCDGRIDWDADCPPSGSVDSWCIEGDCRIECDPSDEFACPGGMECVTRDHQGQDVTVCMPIVGNCGGQTCPTGWLCVNDVCVNPCDPNPCEWYEECRTGFCVDVSCTGVNRACPTGEFCVDHACAEDPCAALDCAGEGGFCQRTCDAESCTAACHPACSCPPGQRCDAQGACEEDPCFGSTCEAGQRCNPLAGGCEPDPCAGILCTPLEICFEGDCLEDPCRMVECPPFYDCVVRTTTDATGDPAPLPGCEPDGDYWIPGEDGDRYLATGGGGCQCDSGGSTGGPPVLGLLFLLGLLGIRTRRARRTTGGAR